MPMICQPGIYLAVITGQKLTTASTGNPQLAFTTQLKGRLKNAADPESLDDEHAGLTRTVFNPITDSTAQRRWAELDALGYTGDTFSDLDPDLAANFFDLTGKEVQLRCTENTWNGNTNERWDLNVLGGGLTLATADAAKAREADALYGRRKVTGKAGTPAGKAPAARGAAGKKEEIQF